jgi:serine/threonine protein kinase
MPLSVGDKLGPFEILAPIGAGGMGEVYKARDTRLDRTVAVKVLPEHIDKREDLRARFEREARGCVVESPEHLHALRHRHSGRRRLLHGDGVSGGRDAGGAERQGRDSVGSGHLTRGADCRRARPRAPCRRWIST